MLNRRRQILEVGLGNSRQRRNVLFLRHGTKHVLTGSRAAHYGALGAIPALGLISCWCSSAGSHEFGRVALVGVDPFSRALSALELRFHNADAFKLDWSDAATMIAVI